MTPLLIGYLTNRIVRRDPDTAPFNILDYARTAGQIATMAQQLDTLLKDAGGTLDSSALDKRIADLNALSARARADATSVLNHAFLLAGGLIVIALVSALVYRRFAPRAIPTAVGQDTPGAKS